jgi:hypothetical protein
MMAYRLDTSVSTKLTYFMHPFCNDRNVAVFAKKELVPKMMILRLEVKQSPRKGKVVRAREMRKRRKQPKKEAQQSPRKRKEVKAREMRRR